MVLDHVLGDSRRRGAFHQSSKRHIKKGAVGCHNPFGFIKQTLTATSEQLRIEAIAQRCRPRGALTHGINKKTNILGHVPSRRQSPKFEPFATNDPYARLHISQMKPYKNLRWP